MNLTRIRAGFAALALILLPSLAFAQGAPVYQSGNMGAPHNLAKITRNGQIQDASPNGVNGDANSRGINPFGILDSNNLGVCTWASVSGNKLCLGHDSSGNAIANVNGTSYPFNPSTNGNITGPNPTTTHHIAVYKNGLGTLLDDPTTFPASFGSLPTSMGEINIGTFPNGSRIQAGVIEGITAAVVVPNTYTQAPQPNTAMSGYIENNNGGATSNSAVGGYFWASQVQGGGQVNAGTFTAQNYRGPYGNNGNDFSNIIGAEVDLSIGQKGGAATPGGIASGIYIRGFSNVDPSGGSTAIRVLSFGTGPNIPWDNGIVFNDGAASIGLTLGATGQGNNVGSMLANWISRTSGGVTNTSTLKTDTTGGFNFLINSTGVFNVEPSSAALLSPFVVGSTTQSAGAGIFLAHSGTNANLQVQGAIHLADGMTIASQNDAFSANKGLELLATTIQLNSTVLQIPNITTGTPVASVCIDASNNIIKKTTAGSCV